MSYLKLLRIIGSMNPSSGGPPHGIRNVTEELLKKGIQTTVVSLDVPESSFLEGSSFQTIALGPVKTPAAFSKKLKPFLKKHLLDFDVVIIHGLWLYHSFATMQVVRSYRRKGVQTPKVYIMPHGMLDPWFQRASSRRWKALRNEVYWALVERQVVNEADGLLFTCQQELELARTTFWGYRPKQEINVGYGILPPPACTEAMSQAFQHPHPYFLFLSRIHEKKGVDILITAYQQLRKENPAGAIPDLVIAGPGLESTYGQKVQGLVQDAYKENISFVGMLSGDRKWGALYGCEAFVLPSHQENFGIAVVEALACGKPVLISDQVNIWRDLEKAEGVYICQVEESSVQKQLNALLHRTEVQKQEVGRGLMKLYQNTFSMHRFTSNLLQLVKE